MRAYHRPLIVCLLGFILLFAFSSLQAGAIYRFKFAIEVFSGALKNGEPLPPIYPEVWMINYPRNVYFAPDAGKLLRKDFNLDTLTNLGSYRIIKKGDDSLMLLESEKTLNATNGWKYLLRVETLLGREPKRVDHFLYRDGKENYPFTINFSPQPTVVYCFRPSASSAEILFVFFSYTAQEGFPRYVLDEFSQEDELIKLDFDPFGKQYPTPAVQPQIIYKSDAVYPAHLLKMNRSDKVELRVLVDRDGTVAKTEIVKKAMYSAFEVAARDAALASLYKPATDANGNKIPAWVPFEVSFNVGK